MKLEPDLSRRSRSCAAKPELALPPLEPLEVHSGMVLGRRRSPGSDADVPPEATDPREVLEELLLPAVSRSPCLVAFSGGRDSSAILAIATHLARRNGLEDPLPITIRYDDRPRTWEAEWQELMVRHMALDRWEIVSVRSEFDVLGALARQTLVRHGLYWPSNAHSMALMLRAAGPGSLITGEGGDELFNSLVRPRKMTTIQVLRSSPLPRALATLAVSRLPAPWRIRAQFGHGLRFPWLRPAARREIRRRFVAERIRREGTQLHSLEPPSDRRSSELSGGIAAALAGDAGVELFEPFSDSRFFRAALAATPREGFPNRNAALGAFFKDVLPPEIMRRTTKARFTEVFWGVESREFATGWDGTGLDPSFVDPDALRREWSKPRPDLRSATPLQAAWLASSGKG